MSSSFLILVLSPRPFAKVRRMDRPNGSADGHEGEHDDDDDDIDDEDDDDDDDGDDDDDDDQVCCGIMYPSLDNLDSAKKNPSCSTIRGRPAASNSRHTALSWRNG